MSRFSKNILDWYSINSRDLPWRKTTDPYAIWVSEIMLQQTKVATVIPYFQKWMEKYPNVQSVSRSSEREILLAWEGLGYYRRAINLWKAAQIIVEKFEGTIPRDTYKLKSLPGIGVYTAGAIASIAFQTNVPVVDGNIQRIISRIFNVKEIINSSRAKSIIMDYLEEVIPTKEVGLFNQALMDLGARVCKPKNPDCIICPLKKNCISRTLGNQNERPVQKEKKSLPTRYFVCAIVEIENQFMIVMRDINGLLGGMWEFPNIQIDHENENKEIILIQYLYDQYGLNTQLPFLIGKFKHTYSHFKQIMYVYRVASDGFANNSENGLIWTKIDKISMYPMGKIFKDIANTLAKGKYFEK